LLNQVSRSRWEGKGPASESFELVFPREAFWVPFCIPCSPQICRVLITRTRFWLTYADDTAFLANVSSPLEASRITQEFLDSYGKWTNRWNISINGRKSQHCNFTLRGKTLPRVELLDITVPPSPQAQNSSPGSSTHPK